MRNSVVKFLYGPKSRPGLKNGRLALFEGWPSYQRVNKADGETGRRQS